MKRFLSILLALVSFAAEAQMNSPLSKAPAFISTADSGWVPMYKKGSNILFRTRKDSLNIGTISADSSFYTTRFKHKTDSAAATALITANTTAIAGKQPLENQRVSTTNSPSFVSLITSKTAKANGEQYAATSIEGVYGEGIPVIEAQSGGTGTNFTPSSAVVGIRFPVSASASFIQGITLRIKTNGVLNSLSSVTVSLYADNGSGVPTGSAISVGNRFSNEMSSTYTAYDFTLQNVTTPLTPSANYWAIITRQESGGGNFVFDATTGTGTTYQGAATGSLSEANVQLSTIVYARNAYGAHFAGNHSHGSWSTSNTGVGSRGDSRNHYGGYFTSTSGVGSGSTSVYDAATTGTSTHREGGIFTSNSTLGYPALRANNSTLAFYCNGPAQFLGKVTFPYTNTAPGTTGAQTIAKPSGIVNFAAGATTLVVTNSLVAANSHIFAQVLGTDATFTSVRVTRATGSFTLTANAAATAETAVEFFVINY